MSEIVFILVTVYVAYVIYSTVYDKTPGNGQSDTAPEPKSSTPVVAAKAESKAAEVSHSPAAPVISGRVSDELRNPKTGEVTKVPNNYRFGKRWIKDALVTEGLLDKVYKNNELDDRTNDKVQAALSELRKMPKYQVQ